MDTLLESGDPWFAAAAALLVGVAVALAIGLAIRLLARRLLYDEDRAQRTSMVAFWGVVAVFGLVALSRLLGGDAAEAGLGTVGSRLFQTLPDLVIGLVLVVVGSVLAAAASAAIIRALAPYRSRLADWLATAARGVILGLALLLAARQVGVQTALIDGLVLLLAAAGLLAVAIAAGLGGRELAGAYAAGRHADGVLTVGDLIELDGHRGRVIRLGPTSVRLHLPDGAIAEVPNAVLLAQTVTVFEHDEPEPADGRDGSPAGTAERTGTGQADDAAGEEPTIITSVVRADDVGDYGDPDDPDDGEDEAPTRTFAAGSAADPEPTAVLDRAELRRAQAGREAAGPAPDEDSAQQTQAFELGRDPATDR